ncbi:AlbA family DNA-binding domain-containing protein [Motiliproteus sediminis]|uniref:AlbA family DNA-binding domain-containing protein n=1 Tax=Motiliproteus sediminis TaxID=1468178 RepID=UPI001AEFF37F|nr:ATP-binding protein [Motiliproteus sediminis]
MSSGGQREFRGISQRCHQLLKMPEGINVDFKRDLSGIKTRTLVAFANSPLGGAVLVGVDEYTTGDGVQRGCVVGCPVDDTARMSIINKATDCIPNLDIEVFVENVSRQPFLRIEIASGRHKPYCTQRGEYAIRTDGRIRALFPDELLAIFMDREGEQFLSRFRNAVYQLENQVGLVNEALNEGILGVSDRLGHLDQQICSILGGADGRSPEVTLEELRAEMQQLRDVINTHKS